MLLVFFHDIKELFGIFWHFDQLENLVHFHFGPPVATLETVMFLSINTELKLVLELGFTKVKMAMQLGWLFSRSFAASI